MGRCGNYCGLPYGYVSDDYTANHGNLQDVDALSATFGSLNNNTVGKSRVTFYENEQCFGSNNNAVFSDHDAYSNDCLSNSCVGSRAAKNYGGYGIGGGCGYGLGGCGYGLGGCGYGGYGLGHIGHGLSHPWGYGVGSANSRLTKGLGFNTHRIGLL